MKQSDLRATLGSISASEDQIARVMKTVSSRTQREETRVSMSRVSFGLRLACAACAFIIVLGLGIYVFNVGGFDDPAVRDYGVQRTNEDAGLTDTEKKKIEDEANSALTALLAESKNIDGDWVIVDGVINAFFFAGGETEDDVYRCFASITVEKLHQTSDGTVACEGEITAEVSFPSDAELNEFINAISSNIKILLEKNDDNHEAAWTVRKIIY